jgi:arsenite methyltransferase
MSSLSHDTNRLAETYDRVSELQLEEGKRLVETMKLAADARVLDVGCGTGRLTQWLAERVAPRGEVIGIEPSEERLALARCRASRAGFELGRAEDLRAFEDASFDAVCMSSVLHWVEDKAKVLSEARRVLRPGGRLGVTTQPQELSKASTLGLTLAPLFARAPYAGRIDRSTLTFARGQTTTELLSLVLETGLELAELHLTPRVHLHASGAAVLEFIEASAFGTFLRPVPEELRPSLRAELLSTLEAQRGAQGIALRGWGLLLVATRG